MLVVTAPDVSRKSNASTGRSAKSRTNNQNGGQAFLHGEMGPRSVLDDQQHNILHRDLLMSCRQGL
jgi:hypothetical protein